MVLDFKEIHKSYGKKHVLKGISFSAASGSAFGLLGRNGAGKTTAIRILMNVLKADLGSVEINGKPIDYEQVSFGYLPEERGLYPKRKVKEQLVFFAMLKGMSKTDAVKAVDFWLHRFGMEKEAGQKLETLSKGNQQKIQFITTIAHDPDIIVLDEPFSGLDPVNASLLKEVVAEKIRADKLVIFSSHQMNYVEEFCDRIAIIHDGTISLSGDLYQIKKSCSGEKLLISAVDVDKIMSSFGSRCERTGEHEVIVSPDDTSQIKETMAFFVNNYDVDRIGVYEPTLNDIFIQHTGNESVSEKI